jgi:hypothetical protein
MNSKYIDWSSDVSAPPYNLAINTLISDTDWWSDISSGSGRQTTFAVETQLRVKSFKTCTKGESTR